MATVSQMHKSKQSLTYTVVRRKYPALEVPPKRILEVGEGRCTRTALTRICILSIAPGANKRERQKKLATVPTYLNRLALAVRATSELSCVSQAATSRSTLSTGTASNAAIDWLGSSLEETGTPAVTGLEGLCWTRKKLLNGKHC
jgi:hypothetical protein